MTFTPHSTSNARAGHRLSSLLLPIVFALLAGGIFAGGYVYYLDLKSRIQNDSHRDLTAIANHKAHLITQWLDEQRGHAEVLRADRLLAREARSGATRDLRTYLTALKQYYDYRSILLLDPKGSVLLTVGEEVRALDDRAAGLAAEAATCGCVMFSDLQPDEGSMPGMAPQKIHMDLLAPLRIVVSGKERVVGSLLLRIDPQTFFYPLVQSWPGAGPAVETMLVRAEGQDVVFLNELRHQKETALSLRMPLESAELPAALLGRDLQDVVEGFDYRGMAVFAAIRPIPGTSWSMVVQMDARERYAPLTKSGRMILSVSALLALFTALIVFLVWLQQKGVAHQHEYVQTERTAADKNLEAFILSLSKELRAPLRGLDGYARQLQAAWPESLDAQNRLCLDLIRTSVTAMERRIDDLLAFSRLSSSPLTPETIPMSGLFQAVFDELRAAEPGRQVSWELRPLPTAQGDLALIREVVRNLLGNAFKFTRGRKTAKLEAGALPAYMGRDGYRTFFVKDNGVGFDMQQADRLFGIFQRLHDLQAFEGSGMGLAIAKQIVERHGGRIWAQSSPDDGAVFFFTLPSREK